MQITNEMITDANKAYTDIDPLGGPLDRAALQAALTAALAKAWRPVEIAPHGRRVLLGWRDWRDGAWCMEVGCASHGRRTEAGSSVSSHGSATDWMPLPEPPEDGVSNDSSDPYEAFAYFVGKCAEGFGIELMHGGKTDTQARNTIIGCLLAFAAGEACRIARREGRDPDPTRWAKATTDAFDRAVKRTARTPPATKEDGER